jgi:hypothetical protein
LVAGVTFSSRVASARALGPLPARIVSGSANQSVGAGLAFSTRVAAALPGLPCAANVRHIIAFVPTAARVAHGTCCCAGGAVPSVRTVALATTGRVAMAVHTCLYVAVWEVAVWEVAVWEVSGNGRKCVCVWGGGGYT